MRVEITAEGVYKHPPKLPLVFHRTWTVTTPMVMILSKDGPAELDKMVSREVENGMKYLAQRFHGAKPPVSEVKFTVDFEEGIYAQRYADPADVGLVGGVGRDIAANLVEALGPGRNLLRQYNEYVGKDPATGEDVYVRKIHVVKDVDAAVKFFRSLSFPAGSPLPFPVSPPPPPAAPPPVCECGGEKTGGGHSSWCPKVAP